MGEGTKIEWADDTFNPWVGCSKVSQACTNCYAENWAKRTGQDGLWRGERRKTSIQNWNKPLRWNREVEGTGRSRRVFCASLADVFEDHPALPGWRADLFALVDATPALTWLLLTKRPENFARFRPDGWARWPRNIWLGTTVEDQPAAEARLLHLSREDATVHFVSYEPALGPLDLRRVDVSGLQGRGSPPTVRERLSESPERVDFLAPGPGQIDWVIAGGESGPKARPSNPEWFRALRDQTGRADVPFLFKQWGEFAPATWSDAAGRSVSLDLAGRRKTVTEAFDPVAGDALLSRVGKAVAGRSLDGRTHDGYPEGRR